MQNVLFEKEKHKEAVSEAGEGEGADEINTKLCFQELSWNPKWQRKMHSSVNKVEHTHAHIHTHKELFGFCSCIWFCSAICVCILSACLFAEFVLSYHCCAAFLAWLLSEAIGHYL